MKGRIQEMFWMCGRTEHDFTFIQTKIELLLGLLTGDKQLAAQLRGIGGQADEH